jgi:hypothetical protein
MVYEGITLAFPFKADSIGEMNLCKNYFIVEFFPLGYLTQCFEACTDSREISQFLFSLFIRTCRCLYTFTALHTVILHLGFPNGLFL